LNEAQENTEIDEWIEKRFLRSVSRHVRVDANAKKKCRLISVENDKFLAELKKNRTLLKTGRCGTQLRNKD
jgi:hypothetical protein